jgi:tannase/feruloyl esterase
MRSKSSGCARLVAAATAALAVAGAALVPVSAAAAANLPSLHPRRDCAGLAHVYRIPGAVTHVEKAEPVAADETTGTPAYCAVEGFVEPAVRFQLKLPLASYSGRYLQYGCDGLCGVFSAAPLRTCGPHGGDMAVAATNDGHVGTGVLPVLDGTWAANDQAARNDYFYRAPHVVSMASKRIITAFYGAPPRRSYFSGCSTGGREGLLLAQRYPHDFDGIVAGAPTNYMAPLIGMYMAWLSTVNVGPGRAPILTSDKLPALHAAVIAACDWLDGLIDGQLEDPRACHYDPGRLQCPPGTDGPSCLTAAQVGVARELYRGLTDDHGVRLYPGWQTRGSELNWLGSIVPIPGLGEFLSPLPDNYLRYVGYPIGTPHSSLAEIRFTVAELRRLTPEGIKGNALSLDLREFRRAGGKLILWHGWEDHAVPAVGTLDYYQRLIDRNGGRWATQRWVRLFMVPAKAHCAIDAEQFTFDPLPALVDWVERHHAPQRIIAQQRQPKTSTVLRSRPVFAYPLRARYIGTGSIDDARNFVPAPPRVAPHDAIRWAGTDLYYRPGPVAP